MKSLFGGLGGGGAFSQEPALHVISVPLGAQSVGSKLEPITIVKSSSSSPPITAGGLRGRNAVKALPVKMMGADPPEPKPLEKKGSMPLETPQRFAVRSVPVMPGGVFGAELQ